jgi:regulator of nucleoside diphosphate kinase
MSNRCCRITETDRWRLGRLLVSSEARAIAEPGVLSRLEGHLEESQTMQSASIPDDVVTMNSIVHLVSETSGARHVCTVVYPEDVELVDASVSVLDALGSGLIGCEVGDAVEWELQGDRGPWRISEIVFQPEKAGAFHL